MADITCGSCLATLPAELVTLAVTTSDEIDAGLVAVHDTARRCAAMWFRVHPVVTEAEGAA